MTLNDAQLRQLRALVVKLLSISDLKFIVSDAGYDLEQLAGANPLKEQAAFLAIVAANTNGWIDKFLKQFANRNSHPDFVAFQQSLDPGVMKPPANPYAVCYPDNRPFVNRSSLRKSLESLVRNRLRILLVRGGPRSGKSHSANLIKALSSHAGFRVVSVNLVRYSVSRDVTPPDIGDALANQLSLGKPPELGNEQFARWTLTYFDWFVGRLDTTQSIWIVIDGFQSISVSQAVHDFVDELCARINQTLLNVRAVLISYERDLDPEMDPILSTDHTGTISVDDLTKFFLQFYRDHKPDLADPETDAATQAFEVALVMRNAVNAPVAEMGRELVSRCRKILETP